MVTIKRFRGNDLIQSSLPNSSFVSEETTETSGVIDGGAEFTPLTPDSELWGEFSNTCHPLESENIEWYNVRVKIRRKSNSSPMNQQRIVTLYGLRNDGSEHMIGEYLSTTATSTETEEDLLFNLRNASGLAPFNKISENGAGSDYLVDLPMRYKFYESIVMHRPFYTLCTSQALVPPTPLTIAERVGPYLVKVHVPYLTGMQADFDDVRFTDQYGTKRLCQYLYEKTDSDYAHFYVMTKPTDKYFYSMTSNGPLMFIQWGDAGATSLNTSAFTLFDLFDDFEDGHITSGRHTGYSAWTLSGGSVDNSSTINGTYGCKHTGGGSGESLLYQTEDTLAPFVVEFKFKVTTQGTVTGTPYLTLFYLRFTDWNNFLRVDTYYDSGTNKQRVRLLKREGGTVTNLWQPDWLTGKIPTNTVYDVRIQDTGNVVDVVIDDVDIFGSGGIAYTTTVAEGKKGFGAQDDTVAVWDDIRIRKASTILEHVTVPAISTPETTTHIHPTSPDPEDTQLLFELPADWSHLWAHPCYLIYNEYGNTAQTTQPELLQYGDTALLGYDGIDQYHAIRVKVEVYGGSNDTVKVPEIVYNYQPI